MEGYYNQEELSIKGFKSIGTNVLISKLTSIICPQKISIGNNVRIDDFSFINGSGSIDIGNNVHIAQYVGLFGGSGIKIGNNCTISAGTKIFSQSDDFSGDYLISPMVPSCYCNITKSPVILHDFVNIGTNSVIMPGVIMHKGSATGAFTFIKKSTLERGLYVGCPSKLLKFRSDKMYQISQQISNPL